MRAVQLGSIFRQWIEREISIEARHGLGDAQLELWCRKASDYDGYVMVSDVNEEKGEIRLRSDVGVVMCLKASLLKWATDNIKYRQSEAVSLPPLKPKFFFVDRKSGSVYTFKDADRFRDYLFRPRSEADIIRDPEVGDENFLQRVPGLPHDRLILFTNLITNTEYSESACFSDLTPDDFHIVLTSMRSPIACVSNLNLSGKLEIGGIPIFSNIFRPMGIYTTEDCPICQSKGGFGK